MGATLRRAFRSAGENFVNAIAGLIALGGGLIPVIVVLWLCWLVVRAIWRRRKTSRPISKPAAN